MSNEPRKVITIRVRCRYSSSLIVIEKRLLIPSPKSPTVAILSDPIEVESFVLRRGRGRG